MAAESAAHRPLRSVVGAFRDELRVVTQAYRMATRALLRYIGFFRGLPQVGDHFSLSNALQRKMRPA